MSSIAQQPGSGILREFIHLLNVKGKLTREQVPQLYTYFRSCDRRLGGLAVQARILSLPEVFRVLSRQSREDLPFGAAAKAEGLLTEAQAEALAGLQRDPLRFFVQGLVHQGLVSPAEADGLVDAYLKWMASTGQAPPSPLPAAPSEEADKAARSRQLLREVRTLGVIPAVAHKVLELTQDPEITLPAVAKVLEADPGLVSTLLRVVNSAAGGLGKPMTTIPAAVQRVGLKGLRNVVLVAVAVSRMSLRDSVQRARLWKHSVKAACWSRHLARRSGACPPDEAFLGGLIHDLGTAVILSTQPAKADVALRLEREGRSRIEAEQWVLGQTHADLGALLCEIWNFAPDLVCAVALHHASIPELRCHPSRTPLVDAVHAGCRLAMEPFDKAEARENAERFMALPEEFRAHHGLSLDVLEGLGDLQAEMEDLMSWMR